MQFVYLDIDLNGMYFPSFQDIGNTTESEVLLNKANPAMSPILMWERIIRISKYIDSSVVICRAIDCEHYRNVIASEHVETVTVLSLSEIEDTAHPFAELSL